MTASAFAGAFIIVSLGFSLVSSLFVPMLRNELLRRSRPGRSVIYLIATSLFVLLHFVDTTTSQRWIGLSIGEIAGILFGIFNLCMVVAALRAGSKP